MKKMIVATDFSTTAFNAARYAVDMAMNIHAQIILLHVYTIPVVYTEVPIAIDHNELIKGVERDMRIVKEELSHAGRGMVNIETVVKPGVFFQELKELCEAEHPYAVVMGSQGSTAAERLFFGSHTIHTMKHLLWPLITVPPTASFKSIKKIGFACDFDKVVTNTPVEEIKMLVHDFNAELHVLNTGKKEEFNPDLVFQSGLLQEILITLNPQFHFITHEDIDEGILNFTEDNDIDLLVVLPKRHNLFENLVRKSHSKELILHSHVPVMALHS
jgi:nucleotide-binding universal stress UspA family protein